MEEVQETYALVSSRHAPVHAGRPAWLDLAAEAGHGSAAVGHPAQAVAEIASRDKDPFARRQPPIRTVLNAQFPTPCGAGYSYFSSSAEKSNKKFFSFKKCILILFCAVPPDGGNVGAAFGRPRSSGSFAAICTAALPPLSPQRLRLCGVPTGYNVIL